MVTSRFDFRPYVAPPRVGCVLASALAQKLVNAAPDDLDTNERTMLERVVTRAAAIDNVRSERDCFAPMKVRPLLLAVAERFRPLYDALFATSRIPPEYGERGMRAARIVTSIFPSGLSFVTLEADAVWNEACRLLRRIDDEGMRDEIDALIGSEHLAAVRDATDRLGGALGITAAKPCGPSSTALRSAVLSFRRAIATYCRTLSVKVDEDDAATIDRFQTAVAPIDDFRANHPTLRTTQETEPA